MPAPSQVFVPSGVTATVATTNVFVGWQSATAAPKTQYIPASTGGLTTIVVADLALTANNYPITVVPLVGSILNGNGVLSGNGVSGTFLDTIAGWVEV